MSQRIGWFERLLCRFVPYRDIVKEEDGKPVLYLRRFFLRRSVKGSQTGDEGGLFLHVIHQSDNDRDPHDHPWDFKSFILVGGYDDEQWEWFTNFQGWGARVFEGYERVKPLTKVERKAEHIHRVRLYGERTAWTLVWTGAKRRSWGFVTKDGWVHWRTYLGL
jgi:hypothetical protein